MAIGVANSAYMTVLDRFRKKRNGRGALLVPNATFIGKVIWDKIIKDYDNFRKIVNGLGRQILH